MHLAVMNLGDMYFCRFLLANLAHLAVHRFSFDFNRGKVALASSTLYPTTDFLTTFSPLERKLWLWER